MSEMNQVIADHYMRALRAADAAGDVQAAQQLAGRIRELQGQSSPMVQGQPMQPPASPLQGLQVATPQAQSPLGQQQQPAPLGTLANPGEARSVSPYEFARAGVRERVSNMPSIPGFFAEAAPATVGALKGAAVGGLLGGPPGVIFGGATGGLLGESVAQATGIAPRSEFNREMAGGAAFLGPAVGGALKLGRMAAGSTVKNFPPAANALGQIAKREGLSEMESTGARILARQQGLMSRPATDLYTAARNAKITVQPSQLGKTHKILPELDKELAPFADFPEVKRAQEIIDRTIAALGEGPVSFDTIVTARKLIGAAVESASRASGVKFGTAKRVFGALADDIDTIARSASRARRPARVSQAAAQRAKLEFSVDELDQAVARFTKDAPGGGIELQVDGLQKWLRDVTNPRSKNYNKNFTSAMGHELPALKSRLAKLASAADSGKTTGPGSLMIQGIAAGTGGAIGYALGGAPGAVLGGLLGTRGPKNLTAALLSQRGSRMLQQAARLGKGAVPTERWAAIGQVVNQLAEEQR